jgi:hypothetical protein
LHPIVEKRIASNNPPRKNLKATDPFIAKLIIPISTARTTLGDFTTGQGSFRWTIPRMKPTSVTSDPINRTTKTLPETSENKNPIKRPITIPVTVNLNTVLTFFTLRVLAAPTWFRAAGFAARFRRSYR